MATLDWCLKQKRGIELVEPNENLSRSYMNEADKTLQSMLAVEGTWKVIMAYYACYHALYSILMKAGVKSEIHDCSIALMKLIDGFTISDITFLEALKSDRIQVQYYLKNKDVDEDKVHTFVFACKRLLKEIDIGKLRGKLNNEEN